MYQWHLERNYCGDSHKLSASEVWFSLIHVSYIWVNSKGSNNCNVYLLLNLLFINESTVFIYSLIHSFNYFLIAVFIGKVMCISKMIVEQTPWEPIWILQMIRKELRSEMKSISMKANFSRISLATELWTLLLANWLVLSISFHALQQVYKCKTPTLIAALEWLWNILWKFVVIDW